MWKQLSIIILWATLLLKAVLPGECSDHDYPRVLYSETDTVNNAWTSLAYNINTPDRIFLGGYTQNPSDLFHSSTLGGGAEVPIAAHYHAGRGVYWWVKQFVIPDYTADARVAQIALS